MQNLQMNDHIDELIDILFDPTARIDEQDDAASYLGEYNDNRALSALIKAAQDPNTDDWLVLDTCAESIADIWMNRNSFDNDVYNTLRKAAKISIFYHIKAAKPEWIEKYNIKID